MTYVLLQFFVISLLYFYRYIHECFSIFFIKSTVFLFIKLLFSVNLSYMVKQRRAYMTSYIIMPPLTYPSDGLLYLYCVGCWIRTQIYSTDRTQPNTKADQNKKKRKKGTQIGLGSPRRRVCVFFKKNASTLRPLRVCYGFTWVTSLCPLYAMRLKQTRFFLTACKTAPLYSK